MRIGIVDYGMGNLRSVGKALEAAGADSSIVSQAREIDQCDKLVLPGVGAFKDAMDNLKQRGLDAAVKRHIELDRPFLGICLGLQLLFDESEEGGRHAGLGIVAGRCVRFDVDRTLGLKVPHMGWNQIEFAHPAPAPLAGLESGCNVYFVHSYHAEPADASIIMTRTHYGRPFVSAIRRDNITAMQFHPEKSQSVGLRMLRNFANG